MSASVVRWRSGLWWIVPTLALAILLGLEVDWGRRVHRLPDAPPSIEPRPVTPTLLPEYKIEGGLAAHAETVNRTLFNPTRRPAPALAGDGGRKQMQRGQFLLTGTTVAGDRSIAFLREVAGGKSRTVRQGEQVNGMLVAEVKTDRVKLTLGDESEELVLKVAAGPRTTIPPAPPAASAMPLPTGQPGGATASAPGQTPSAADATQTLEQRRRAARAAAADAAATPPVPASSSQTPGIGGGAPGIAAPSPGMPASAEPAWNDVYERMRQRVQPPPRQ